MCGICGFTEREEATPAPRRLEAMAASLQHRGPDARAAWFSADERCGLATARLSIIDLPGGAQPMRSADGRHVLVFNGEIYNFHSLRRELAQRGHRFRTASDTEVLLEAYRAWGRACVQRLRGMFAFAVYDSEQRLLFLARDRTGIKPLYYHAGVNGFYFASEIKALLTVPHLPRRLNYAALGDYCVLGYPVAPATFFADIHELPPGAWLEVSPRGLTRRTYWSWERQAAAWDEETALEHVAQALTSSLREHLIADVPLGAFLSGGLDSSLLAALIVRELGRPLETFNVAFSEAGYDESPYARLVARHLGTRHHEIVVASAAADLSLLDEVARQFDQPFADSSAIPTYLICREIRRAVKVALAGDGGDEMFGGYEKFRYANAIRRLGRLPGWGIAAGRRASRLGATLAPALVRKTQRLLRAAAARNGNRLLALNCYTYPEQLGEVLAPPVMEELRRTPPACFSMHACADDPGGAELLDWTIRYELPGDYLRKVDMMSSAHGLEVREPLLGEAVLACAARLPEPMKYSLRQTKVLLRKLAARYLPRTVVEKPKAGFGIPLDAWLGLQGREAMQATLCSSKARLRDLIRPDHLEPLLQGFVTQRWAKAHRSRFLLYQQVYLLWSLERWLATWNPTL
ncbi:MAG: asparagine synthase (glutamine-hydrolyzing) [Candidatus Tectomicrobia bacterium]|nr:asparagine synthase (glutamine-hydrolyzing) [Candidatus Tectomicrobia bacterium]